MHQFFGKILEKVAPKFSKDSLFLIVLSGLIALSLGINNNLFVTATPKDHLLLFIPVLLVIFIFPALASLFVSLFNKPISGGLKSFFVTLCSLYYFVVYNFLVWNDFINNSVHADNLYSKLKDYLIIAIAIQAYIYFILFIVIILFHYYNKNKLVESLFVETKTGIGFIFKTLLAILIPLVGLYIFNLNSLENLGFSIFAIINFVQKIGQESKII